MPHKTCTLDCIYCECGKTTHLTLERKAYIPVDQVQEELSSFLNGNPELDYITFSGSGEPTLHSGIQQIARFVKHRFPRYKVALLTNGTLFDHKKIRDAVADIDLIIASVDAATDPVFRRINRPHPALDLARINSGLIALGKEHPGQLWIEVFLAPGVNDSDEELGRIREMLSLIQPDKIQLNSLDRPGTEKWVAPMEKAAMARATACIHATELIKPPDTRRFETNSDNIPKRLLAAIRRRPCTAVDISHMLGVSEVDVRRHLQPLLDKKVVIKEEMPRGTFYSADG